VKIRGHRIEIPEVEAAVQSSSLVRQAAVVAAGDPGSLDRKLVAFVTLHDQHRDDRAALASIRSAAATLLSPAHQPSDWRLVDALPLTATGKVDRRTLIDLAQGDAPPSAKALPPAGELAAVLTSLFSDVIGRQINPGDDFFSAGGDSVGAVELFARLAAEFGVRFPLRLLAEASSPARLADRLHTYDHQGSDVLVPFADVQTGRAFYLIHGAGGTAIGFAELAAALAPSISLVGVQAFGTDGQHPPDVSVAAMAERYASAIADRHCPETGGALWVGGYSDGGLIALRTASLLAARGFQLQPVVLVDAFLGTSVPRGVTGRFRTAFVNLFDQPGRSIVLSAIGGWRGWRVRHTSLRRDEDIVERMAALGHRDLFDVVLRACREDRRESALRRHPVDLIRCADYNPFEVHDYSWIAEFASSRTVRWSSGHHLSMLRAPHATRLAAVIADLANLADR
jgi:thioesterase domain-containing protein/acyl carrier protein